MSKEVSPARWPWEERRSWLLPAAGFRANPGEAYLLAYIHALLKTAQSNKGKA